MNRKIFSFLKNFQGKKINLKKLMEAERKASELGIHAKDLLLIVNLVRDCLKGNYRIEKKHLAVLIGAIVYVVSPVDAVIDTIPVLGWIDDGTVIAYVSKNYCDVLKGYKEFTTNISVTN